MKGPLPKIRARQEVVLLILIVALLSLAGILDPTFVRLKTQLKLSANIWELALIAIPMTLIIITAGIDLSVGSIVALTTVVFGLLINGGVNHWTAAAAALGTGVLAGMLNGYLVSHINVHPLIVTLATLAAYRGIAEGASKGIPVSPLPKAFTNVLGATLWGFPLAGTLFLILAVLTGCFLAKSCHGRYIYAIGHNTEATRFCGIPVQTIVLGLYTFSGIVAATTALLYAARRNTANPEAGIGYELDVITAVVMGGTSIYGGRGSILGTALGIILIHEAREFVKWRWSSDELNLIVIGSLLILSVIVHRVLSATKETQ